jgi:hypothetical protein
MPLFAQSPAQKVGPSTSFHPDQGHAQVRGETQKLVTRALLAYYNFPARVDTNKMKHRLPKINA